MTYVLDVHQGLVMVVVRSLRKEMHTVNNTEGPGENNAVVQHIIRQLITGDFINTPFSKTVVKILYNLQFCLVSSTDWF